MKMEFELKELVGGKDSFMKLLNADLPIKVSYRLSKTIKKIEEELKHFDTQRIELLKKYGEPIENGTKYQVKDLEGFNKDMNELLAEKVEINVTTIDLKDIEKASLSAIDLSNLSKLIKEE